MDLNRVRLVPLIGILHLKDEHIPKYFFPSKQVELCRSVSVLESVDSQFLDAIRMPTIDISVQKQWSVSNNFAVVEVRSHWMGIGQTDQIVRMVAS